MKSTTHFLLFLLISSATLNAAPLSFNKDIRPILAANCFACHGADEESREAKLRIDVRDNATLKRDGRAAIVEGKSGESELYRRIASSDPDILMPPPDSGHKLTPQQIALLKSWIDEGARYDRHWSFVMPVRPALPEVRDKNWTRNEIDHFLLAKIEAAGLTPNDEANRFTLIRRLYLDLTGLPPKPQDVDAFVADKSDNAFEKVVDQLLESKSFGEHWARMWLDLARYADTKGYEKDQPRNIWRYRDWVIDALNADMPFDQFTTEQIAGDLVDQPTSDQLLATAFHRNTMTNDEGGTDNEEFRIAAVKDRVDTTIQVWMGLTMGCAKCHSHKYDPITQHEYYQFLGFFNQTEDADRGDDAPRAKTPTAAQKHQLEKLKAELAKLRTDQATAEQIKAAEKQVAEFDKQLPTTPVMRELPANRRRKTHIHVRGNFLQKGDEVQAGLLGAFGVPVPKDVPANRLAVARWLLAEENPLTPRVVVNRFWSRFFGVGIVETEEDFGTQGALPSHPQLLDWLAIEFRDSLDWSIKKLCKEIVMSAAYRQSAQVGPTQLDKDPANRLLSRSARFRLPAETIRDQALASSGLLSNKIGGPSVMPVQPPGIWRTTYSKLKWQTSTGEDRYRRSLYTFWRRTSPYPSLLTFDAGSREVCMVRRVRTNTPLQALVLMNDPGFVEAAGALAEQMIAQPDRKGGMRHGFRRVLVRPPTDDEMAQLLKIYEQVLRDYESHEDAAKMIVKAAAMEEALKDTPPAEIAAWAVIGNILLNLDETIMRP